MRKKSVLISFQTSVSAPLRITEEKLFAELAMDPYHSIQVDFSARTVIKFWLEFPSIKKLKEGNPLLGIFCTVSQTTGELELSNATL